MYNEYENYAISLSRHCFWQWNPLIDSMTCQILNIYIAFDLFTSKNKQQSRYIPSRKFVKMLKHAWGSLKYFPKDFSSK